MKNQFTYGPKLTRIRFDEVHPLSATENIPTTEFVTARSAVYGFLANALGYPDGATVEALSDQARVSAMSGLLQDNLPEYAGPFDAISKLTPILETYNALFGHAVRGACPPYELEYNKSDIPQRASELADIAGFYNAFGMVMADDAHERVDHIAVEFELMSALAAKQAYAIENDDSEAQQILYDAQRAFLTDHIGWWVPAFAARLEEADPDGFYGKVGAMIGRVVETDCALFDTTCGPQYLELRPVDPKNEASIDCGTEESCPGADTSKSLVQLRIDR